MQIVIERPAHITAPSRVPRLNIRASQPIIEAGRVFSAEARTGGSWRPPCHHTHEKRMERDKRAAAIHLYEWDCGKTPARSCPSNVCVTVSEQSIEESYKWDGSVVN